MSAAGSDAWASAAVIAPGDVSAPTPNSGLTLEPGEPQLGVGLTAWWQIQVVADQTLSLDTFGSSSGADTIMAVYTGAAVDALTQVASNDDAGGGLTSRVVFPATGGVTYWVQVDAYNTTAASYVLAASTVIPGGGNDLIADALPLTTGIPSGPVDGSAYTIEPGESAPGVGRTAWWTWTADRSAPVIFDTYYSTGATKLSVYRFGPDFASMRTFTTGTGTQAATAAVTVTAGETYWIQVDAATTAPTSYSLSVAYVDSASATIPCGSADYYTAGGPYGPSGNSLPHVQSSAGISAGNDDRDLMSSASTIDEGALSAPDTATFDHLDHQAFDAAMKQRYGNPAGGSVYYLNLKGQMDTPAAIPAGALSLTVSVTLTVRATSTESHRFAATLYPYNASGAQEQSVAFTSSTLATTAWQTITMPAESISATSLAATIADLNARRGLILVGPRNFSLSPTFADEFAYLALNLTWTTYTRPAPQEPVAVTSPTSVTPPLRQHPRTDGLGTSSARRMWPPPRSVQASIRRAGGYF